MLRPSSRPLQQFGQQRASAEPRRNRLKLPRALSLSLRRPRRMLARWDDRGRRSRSRSGFGRAPLRFSSAAALAPVRMLAAACLGDGTLASPEGDGPPTRATEASTRYGRRIRDESGDDAVGPRCPAVGRSVRTPRFNPTSRDDDPRGLVDEDGPPGLAVIEEAAEERVESAVMRLRVGQDGEDRGATGLAVLDAVLGWCGHEDVPPRGEDKCPLLSQ